MQDRDRNLAVILGIVLVVILLFGLFGGGMMGGGMMGWGGSNLSPWWGIAMMFMWVLIVGGIAILAGWLFRQGQPTETGSWAIDLLKERYARGEITREHYEQMRRDLET